MVRKFNGRTISAQASAIPYTECRAKTCPDGTPGTFVYDHCRYVGYVAKVLLTLLPKSICNLLPKETPFFVSLHDIGKVSPGFEGKYFKDLLKEKGPLWAVEFDNGGVVKDHASIGAKALMKMLCLDSDNPLVRAVVAHHGFASTPPYQYTNDGAWQDERVALVRALEKEFDVSKGWSPPDDVPVDLLTGITCVADWIASDEDFFPPSEAPLTSKDGHLRAASAVARCGFNHTDFRLGLSFRDIFGFEPYPAQQAFIDTVTEPGVYVLEAPMGMGKTESALYAASRLIEKGVHSGLYFALPTRLTSDRIHKRVEQFLKAVSAASTPVKLAHGQAWLKEFESGAEGSDKAAGNRPPPWFNPSKRGLLFPFAVGTIDQALLSVLNVKHSFVRSFALAGKVVVLDEVHSYDAYTGTLLDELVKRLRELGCTVIILSATLTAARRKALLGENAPDATGYPLLTGLRATGEAVVSVLEPPPSREVHLRWIDAVAESPLAVAVEKARAGCNVLCIANTVATAQEWYRRIKANEMYEGDEFPIGLLHAKFTAHDRDHIENEWMAKLGKPDREGRESARPHGSILISTQIVEQSVDIDADWMLSELAPVDMLLQRLGRLWRHDRQNRPIAEPELAVVCAKMPAEDLSDLPSDTKELEEFFGRGVWVYAPYVLLRTLETLRGRRSIRVPDDIRALLEAVYAEAIPDAELHQALFNDMREKAERLRRLAIMGQSDALPTKSDDEESAGTRYNSRPSVSLLIARSVDAVTGRIVLLDGEEVVISRFERNFKVTRELYRNLVQVAPNDALKAAPKKLEGDLLAKHFFPSEMPVVCKWDLASGALSIDGTDTPAGYCYHPLYGAYRTSAEKAEVPEPSENPDVPETPNIPNVLAEYHQIPDPEGEFYFKDNEDW